MKKLTDYFDSGYKFQEIFVCYMKDNGFEIEVRSGSFGRSTMYLRHNSERIYNVMFMNNNRKFRPEIINANLRLSTHVGRAFMDCLLAAMNANADSDGVKILQAMKNYV